jgi:hypothetical protein
MQRNILMMWRRLDNPGHEWARLYSLGSTSILRGTAVFQEDRIPGRLDYKILCSPQWETQSAVVLGWVGDEKVDLRITKAPDHGWLLNGESVPGLGSCLDIDLSFSPSTNLLPIRRLNLQVGQEAEVRAAWMVFPELGLRPMVHWFRRKSRNLYSYRSDTGFSVELKVNEAGFVVDYPPLWIEEQG